MIKLEYIIHDNDIWFLDKITGWYETYGMKLGGDVYVLARPDGGRKFVSSSICIRTNKFAEFPDNISWVVR